MKKKIIPVGKRGVLYMPKEILKEFNVAEGDYMEVYGTKDGIVLKPKTLVDKDQAWFWTSKWQKMEKEVDEDIKKGRIKRSNSIAELKKDLME
jgi:antitoxin MazE